jgi:hypothetical protein
MADAFSTRADDNNAILLPVSVCQRPQPVMRSLLLSSSRARIAAMGRVWAPNAARWSMLSSPIISSPSALALLQQPYRAGPWATTAPVRLFNHQSNSRQAASDGTSSSSPSSSSAKEALAVEDLPWSLRLRLAPLLWLHPPMRHLLTDLSSADAMFTPVTWLLSLPLSLWPNMYLHTVPSVALMHELADARALHPALRAAGVMDAVATVLYEELEPSQKLEGAEAGVDDSANPQTKPAEKRGAAETETAEVDRSSSASSWNQVGQWLDEQRLVPSRVTVEQLAALTRLLCALQRSSSSSSPSSSSLAAAAAVASSSPSSSSPPSSSSSPSEQSLALVVRALCALVVEAPRMGPVEEQKVRLAVAERAAIELAHMLLQAKEADPLLSHHSPEQQQSSESALDDTTAAAKVGDEATKATASSSPLSDSVHVRSVLRAVLSETCDAWIPHGSGSAVILESGASAVRRRWLRRSHPLTAGPGSGEDGNGSASAAASVQTEVDLPSLSPAGMAALEQVCAAFRRAGQELGEQYAIERASGRLGAPGSPQFFRSLSMPGGSVVRGSAGSHSAGGKAAK